MPPDSETLRVVASIVMTGGRSSSVSVTVAVGRASETRVAVVAIVTVKVSAGSKVLSSVSETVRVAVVSPAVIVKAPPVTAV